MKKLLTPLLILLSLIGKSQCASNSDSLLALSFPYQPNTSCSILQQSDDADRASAYFLRALCIKDGLPYTLADCASSSDSLLAYSFPFIPNTGCSLYTQATPGERARVFFLRALIGVSGGGGASNFVIQNGTGTTVSRSKVASDSIFKINVTNNIPNPVAASILETYNTTPSATMVWKTPTNATGDSLLNCSYAPIRVYNVYTQWGLKPDSSTDNSPAFKTGMQAAQNQWWRDRMNFVVYFPYVSGTKNYYAFNTLYILFGSTNVQSLLWMPKDSNATTAYTQQETITIKGGDLNSPSSPASNTPQIIGIRIGCIGKGQPTMTNGQPAVIAVPEGLANTTGFNQIKLDISGLTIVARNGTNEAGVYAPYAESMNLHDVNITTDTAPSLALINKSAFNVGAYFPGAGNGAFCYMNDVNITGFNTGFVVADHFSSNQRCYISYAIQGCRALQATHNICITDILFQNVKFWINCTTHNVINPFGATKAPLCVNIDGEYDATVSTTNLVQDSGSIGIGIAYESVWPRTQTYTNDAKDSNVTKVDVLGLGQLSNNSTIIQHDIPNNIDLFQYQNNSKRNTTETGFCVANSNGESHGGLWLQNSSGYTTLGLLKSDQTVFTTNASNGMLMGTNNLTLQLFTNGASTAGHQFLIADASQRTGIGTNASVNTASWLNISAGTTTIAALTYASGTLMTTPTLGAKEYNGTNFYQTPFSTERGVVPQIDINNDLTSQSSSTGIDSITTPAANQTYEVGGYINVSAISTDQIALKIVYTDESNTAQIINMPLNTILTGIVVGTGNNLGISTSFRAKASTKIALRAILTTSGGSITFNCGGWIKRLIQ